MMVRIGGRWLNLTHAIGAERTGPDAIRVYLLRGMAWDFTGPDAAELARRLDMEDQRSDAPPDPGAGLRGARDISERIPFEDDDDDEDGDSTEQQEARSR